MQSKTEDLYPVNENLYPPPPPPTPNVQGGRMRIPISISGKGPGIFWPLSREDFPEKTGKGGVFKPMIGVFSETSREIQKKGV